MHLTSEPLGSWLWLKGVSHPGKSQTPCHCRHKVSLGNQTQQRTQGDKFHCTSWISLIGKPETLQNPKLSEPWYDVTSREFCTRPHVTGHRTQAYNVWDRLQSVAARNTWNIVNILFASGPPPSPTQLINLYTNFPKSETQNLLILSRNDWRFRLKIRSGEIALLVQFLLYKKEDLNLDPPFPT